MRRSLLVLLTAATTACAGGRSLDLDSGCNPLMAGADCLLPYPSDFFRVEDDSMPNGFRIEHIGPAEQILDTRIDADLTEWRPMDGFSRTPTLVFHLGHEASPAGFVEILDDPELSRSPDTSRTLLLDAVTGRAVAHWVDVDPLADEPR